VNNLMPGAWASLWGCLRLCALLALARSLTACSSPPPTKADSGYGWDDVMATMVASCVELQDAVVACGPSIMESQWFSWFEANCSENPNFPESLCWMYVIRDTDCGQTVGMAAFDGLIGECVTMAEDEEVDP
jgi:hypothetical protein